MRSRDWVVVLVDDEMAAVWVLVALVEIGPGGEGETGELWVGWPGAFSES